MLIRGKAIKKPANAGFFSDNQLATDIIMLDIKSGSSQQLPFWGQNVELKPRA